MTWLDRLLRDWRMRVALQHLPAGWRVLDIGTHDGSLFAKAAAGGVGIDPELVVATGTRGRTTFVKGMFPSALGEQPAGSFDAATALAVVEHVPDGELSAWASALAGLLRPGGRLIITVPAPTVDHLLHVLMALRLVNGMQAHEHHGFVPGDLHGLFAAPQWRLALHRTFQLGLNHLFVFERTSAP